VAVQLGFRTFTLDLEFIQNLQIREAFACFMERPGPELFVADGFQDQLGSLGIVPEFGSVGQLLFFCNKGKLFIDVKDTSSKHPAGTGCPSRFPV
jgi:hypothetical protein